MILLCLFTTKFSVASADENDVELISYSQLMSLPLEKRVAYIEGVQQMLIELSKSPGHFSDSDPKARTKLKAWLEILSKEMKSAEAQSGSSCRLSSECQTKLATCFSQNLDVKWDGKSYVCDKQNRITRPPNVSGADAWAMYSRSHPDPRVEADASREAAPVVKIVSTGSPAPATDLVKSLFPERKLAKFTAESFPTPEAYANDQVKRGNAPCRSKFQSQNFPGAKELSECTEAQEVNFQVAFQRQLVKSDSNSGGTRSISAFAAPAAASEAPRPAEEPAPVRLTGAQVSGKIDADAVHKLVSEKKNPNALCDAEAKKAGTGPMTLIRTNEGGDDFYCMTEAAEKQFREGKLVFAGAALPPGAEARARKPTSPAGTSESGAPASSHTSKYSCAPTPVACPDPKTAKKNPVVGNQKCVFAGMISELDSSNIKCAAVTEFELNGTKLKCGSGQSLCNPMLFGAVSDTKPICVGRGNDVTLQCSKLSSARDGERFINRNVTGLQEKWDAFQTDLRSICKTGSDSAKFHCVECNIMQARIFEINARILADPCNTRTTDPIGSRIQIRKAYPDQPKSSGVKK